MTLWSGRFSASMSQSLWELSESYSFDHVLYAYDLRGSRAHVAGLVAAGLLDDDDAVALLAALDQVESEFDRGVFVRSGDDEDVHMAIERRVIEISGDVGARLHTGRSRNDQVATTTRLFARDAAGEVARAALDLVAALRGLGDRYPEATLPGYTHLQRAQPVLLSHHASAHAWALLRDVDRLMDARDRLDVSPLGAGALAGTSLPIDPAVAAAELGFAGVFANSMDAVSDRDFVVELVFDLALLGVHVSRMGEELVLWTTAEFGFARLGEEFTTGSSMLPQKRNSDVAELARGKSGRLVGHVAGLLATLKGLPLAYNRDLQEDKEPLFDAVNQSLLVLRAMAGAYRSLEFDAAVAGAAAADETLVAVDVAEALVAAGTPFRRAHERVGQWVAEAIASGEQFSAVVGRAEPSLAGLFAPGVALASRRSPGGAGSAAAADQRALLASAVASATRRVGAGPGVDDGLAVLG